MTDVVAGDEHLHMPVGGFDFGAHALLVQYPDDDPSLVGGRGLGHRYEGVLAHRPIIAAGAR